MTSGIRQETKAYLEAKDRERADAAGSAAFFLTSGIDLARALEAPAQERHAMAARLRRLLERERQKGQRRHWSYDLNRHIALKRALDRLTCRAGCGMSRPKR